MKKITSLFVAMLLLLSSCGSVPLTGRKQVLLVSDQEVLSSSLTQYSDYMKSAKKSSSKDGAAMVIRVGKKIAAATEQYLRNNGLESEIKNFAWEFNLVNDPQVNAFCMPGGKIVVYEVNAGNVGRNADELLRRLHACQFVYEHGDNVCPAKWKLGEKTIQTTIENIGK